MCIRDRNKEDLLCIEIVEEIGQKLGKQIAGLINIFNPELVIIGGTLSLTGDYITQPIKTAVRKYSLNLVNKDSAIITSKPVSYTHLDVYKRQSFLGNVRIFLITGCKAQLSESHGGECIREYIIRFYQWSTRTKMCIRDR